MRKFIKIILILTIVFSLLTTLAVSCAAVYLMRYRDNKVPEELLQTDYSCGKTTFYYYDFEDRTARIGEAKPIEQASLDSGTYYKYVSLNDLPDDLINAFIAIEDKRYYKHNGIDLKRTTGAAINYLLGTGSFGGSTITQQLVKNLTGQNDFSVHRKLREGFCALDLENKCDKAEILEIYLNIINLSQGCRGVGAAAELYFSKKPEELSLTESASIAAITNNPSLYDPIRHPENNKKRRDLILHCMLEQKYIDDRSYRKAVEQPVLLNVDTDYKKKLINSWYIDMVTADVLSDLSAKYNITQKAASLMLYRGGYKIYTAMDPQIQTIIEDYYADIYNFPIDSEGNMPQSSMIVIDPFTGDILGVAGSVGQKKGNRLQNFATDTKRPPGSVIKPLSVYAPALEKGIINWCSQYEDAPIPGREVNGRPWPSNVSNTYRGKVDIRKAVESSLNTVAVRVLDELGSENSMAFLRDTLQIKSLDPIRDSGAASLALGQPSQGVTLREITAAYSIFQEGIMSKPRSYFKVTDAGGKIILDNSAEQKAVLSPENASIMTKLMENVVDSGTAKGAVSLDKRVDVAGKTGTTNNNCDRYFVGYTPTLLAGTWFGYEYPQNLEHLGSNLSVAFWDEVMTEIYEKTEYGKKETHFKVPENVVQLSYDLKTNAPSSTEEYPDQSYIGWFVLGNNPE